MAKKASVKAAGDFLLKLLVGLLFICIGIQGIAGERSNDLYREIGNNTVNIILGIVLLLCGLFIIIPLFTAGAIKASLTKWSMIVTAVVWILIIVISDFVYGFRGISGIEIFYWLETFIYHLLILTCILNASKSAFKKIVA